MNSPKYLLLTLAAISLAACQSEKTSPIPEPKAVTEWLDRPSGFEENYSLEQMVVLSRHNIRSPMVSKNSVLTRLTNPTYTWFAWEGAPSSLTAKGERLETKMGTFFREWLGKKGFIDRYSDEAFTFRFYANAKQRCQKTAERFAEALLPGENPRVEMNVQYDSMDPVFNPQITKTSASFEQQALQEVEAKFGDLDEGIAEAYAMIENIIDIAASPAYPDTSSFSQYTSSMGIILNAEPFMTGGLKMACSVSDALVLQYYEEPDAQKAAFGHDISFNDWVTVSSAKEWYQNVLFSVYPIAVNVAHPLLQVILDEMQNRERIFSFLCGHDSNISSVLSALRAEETYLPGSVEQAAPIGCKLIFETFRGGDGTEYADILLVYSSAEQLREESALSYTNPPAGIKLSLSGLTANEDGLYSLSDVEQRLSAAIRAYDTL